MLREASFPRLVLEFAEFLKYYYLNRLSIFYLSTCVGLQYGLKSTQNFSFYLSLDVTYKLITYLA